MIAIIDYGMGNLHSVQKAFEFLGFSAEITQSPEVIRRADKLILPGVGAFQDAMTALKKSGMDCEIAAAVKEEKPFLGICLGMQLLFEKSTEHGEHAGLGILPGEIKRLSGAVRIPHIGWNSLHIQKRSPLFVGLPDEPYVYFVHSYYLETDAPIVSATTDYGQEIQVAVQQKQIFALQFHPEKSGDIGLNILQNFGGL